MYAAAMRLRSDIFVSALMRRVFARGDFAAIEVKGAEEAGAVFVRQVFRDGSESLHAPAPQSVFEAEESGLRRFETRLERARAEAVADALARERRFDGDLWVVSIETDDLGDLIDFAGAEPKDDGFFRR
ncbi:DUF1491 domain-containing protein [Shinella sp. WSC3-e]|nr:conserved hypothetical protein [Rhizobiaceae bacterium]CAK7255308.1 DUF1491 domain-containing protein [Shinella sp. WSC3-e]